MKRWILLWVMVLTLGVIKMQAAVIHIPVDYPTIQQGIINAVNGDTVLIQPGTYVENINFNGKNIVVGSLFIITNDTTYISSTIIAGSPSPGTDKSVVTFENNETPAAQLIGLTLRNGEGNNRLLGSDYVLYGGGIFCNNASPFLSHLIVTHNTAECGGGIFLYNSNSLVENCWIKNNVCNSVGIAAPNAGGAIAVWNCTNVSLHNNIIHANIAAAGGAVYTLTSYCHMANCLLTDNHGLVMGAAFYCDSWSDLHINNCTVYGNLCDEGPGIMVTSMMYCLDSARVTINNSVVYGNRPTTIVCQFNYSENQVTLFHTDFEGGQDSIFTNNGGNNVVVHWLSGNIHLDPQFVNPAINDFHLLSSSPCINSGDTTGISGIPLMDLDSNNRCYGTIDMGCYEFQGSPFSINSYNSGNSLHMYPNPADEFIMVQHDFSNAKMVSFALYNVQGAVLSVQKIDAAQNPCRISVSGLPDGVYFIQLTDGENLVNNKCVIAH